MEDDNKLYGVTGNPHPAVKVYRKPISFDQPGLELEVIAWVLITADRQITFVNTYNGVTGDKFDPKQSTTRMTDEELVEKLVGYKEVPVWECPVAEWDTGDDIIHTVRLGLDSETGEIFDWIRHKKDVEASADKLMALTTLDGFVFTRRVMFPKRLMHALGRNTTEYENTRRIPKCKFKWYAGIWIVSRTKIDDAQILLWVAQDWYSFYRKTAKEMTNYPTSRHA